MHYIISDTHFGHENIKTYEPIRKDFDDERLIQLWNETAHRLNGKITLLKGNHDFKKPIFLNCALFS